jgi:hypothetical protein
VVAVTSTAFLAPEIPRELAFRQQRSLEITLAWRPSDDSVFLLVLDLITRDAAVVQLPDRSDAMRAFREPFSYPSGDYRARCLRRSLRHPEGDG